MKHSHSLRSATLWLTGAMLLLRGIGLLYQVFLAKLFTTAQLGRLELFMAVYGFATTLAVSGIRLSATRLIIIGATRGCGARQVLRKTCLCSLCFGLFAMAFLWMLAPIAATHWLHDAVLAIPMRILALCLPFLSLESCFGGYFTAIGKATRFTVIQVPQQLISLPISLFLLQKTLPMGLQVSCIALAGSLLFSEVLGLTLILLFRPKDNHTSSENSTLSFLDFFRIALPDAGSSWLRSALVAAKNLMIPRGLRQFSGNAESALSVYGTIQSMTLPVLTFPSVLISAFNIQILPEISRCHETGQVQPLRNMVQRNCRVVLSYSLLCSAVIFLSADWLGGTLYPGTKTAFYLRWLAPLIPLMYLDTTVDTFLRGMGLQVSSMFYNIIDAAVCLSMVLVLLPRIGIPGYLMVLYTSELLNLFLSLHKLQEVLNPHLQQKDPVR